MAEQMTPRERWLASIRLDPVDRLPFWPKLGPSYPFAQDTPFRTMDVDAIHEWIGSDRHVGIRPCVKEARSATGIDTVRDGNTMRTLYRTPHATLEMVQQFDEPSRSWHPVEFPVKSAGDIETMRAIFEDVTVELDPEGLETTRDRVRQIGQSATTMCTIGKSPLMDWLEFLAGVEMGHYLLSDCRPQVEALFEAAQSVLARRSELLAEHSPADVFYMMENTSTTLISPDQFQRYCAPHILQCVEIVRAAGRIAVLHMCGLLKDLLPDLARIPAQAFEAFTSPTLGNTSWLDGRSQCPDTCLIGGTNAVLWTQPASEIIAQIDHDLAELPHHRGIVVTSAGVMPPLASPATIKAVGDWVKAYPARL